MRKHVFPIHRRSLRKAAILASVLSVRAARPSPISAIPVSDEVDYAFTAESVIDDPREPRIEPTGLLDSRGVPLVRLIMPIKIKMGFSTSNRDEEVEDTCAAILPADSLQVTNATNHGEQYVDIRDLEGSEDCEELEYV